jgi:hypothetical protein
LAEGKAGLARSAHAVLLGPAFFAEREKAYAEKFAGVFDSLAAGVANLLHKIEIVFCLFTPFEKGFENKESKKAVSISAYPFFLSIGSPVGPSKTSYLPSKSTAPSWLLLKKNSLAPAFPTSLECNQ